MISKEILEAAEHMDWQQVAMNGGPPCFHLDDDGSFCGRAKRWCGHHADRNGHTALHEFVSLKQLLSEAEGPTNARD